MRTIYKYPLQVIDSQVVQLPGGGIPLTVQVQNDIPVLWSVVNTDLPNAPITINTYGTGHPIVERPGEYLATYQLCGGGLVFHVFYQEPIAQGIERVVPNL